MPNDQIIIYQVSDSETTIDVQLTEDTVWLNQRQMAELFDKNVDTIGLHIRNIYKEGELEPEATTEESSVVQEEAGRSVSIIIRLKKKQPTYFILSLKIIPFQTVTNLSLPTYLFGSWERTECFTAKMDPNESQTML